MHFTVDKNNDCDTTFSECFDQLETQLSDHHLLMQDEREECVDAVQRLKRVFGRFRKSQGD